MTGDSCKTRDVQSFTVAIIGAGELGRSLAYASALAGFRTILEDISPSALEQGIAWIAKQLNDEIAHRKIGAEACDAARANLCALNSAEDAAREADLIIETASDDMEMKIELFTVFDKFAKPGAIFATTTTSLSITEIADVTFCPEQCIRMRFLVDSSHAERLELIKGRETSEETIASCREIGQRMGREVSVLSEAQVLSAISRA